MKNILIYCEGVADSHDHDILSNIKKDLSIKPVIVPLGGKKGAGGFISIHSKQTQTVDFYLFFRDRDFDVPIDTNTILHTTEKKDDDQKVLGKWCYSYRNTIENYLLNPITFFRFLEEKGECKKYGLQRETDVKDFFDKIGEELAHYQAVRHALGKMRIPTDFGTKWTSKSGILPQNLTKEFCVKEAWKLIEIQKTKMSNWTEETLNLYIEDFYTIFTEPNFYTNMDYLVWYQGKDFAKRITQKLPQLEIGKYYEFAKKSFDYTQFPDLVQFRELIEQKSNP